MNLMFKAILIVILILLSVPFFYWFSDYSKPYIKKAKIFVKTIEKSIED